MIAPARTLRSRADAAGARRYAARVPARRSALCCVTAIAWLGVAASGVAAQPSPDVALETVRELLLYASYPEAIAEARRLLERTDLDARRRNLALERLAIAHLAQRDGEADRVLDELYRRDPGHRLTDADASPPVLAAFARARERRPEPVVVELEHQAPTPTSRRSPVVEVRITTGREAVQELRLFHRRAGEPGFEQTIVDLAADGRGRATIPLGGTDSRSIDYYLVAVAPSLTPLGGLASQHAPLTLAVPEPETPRPEVRLVPAPTPEPEPFQALPAPAEEAGPSGRSRWWVGVLVGLAVVGAGVGVGLSVRQEAPRGTLGAIELQ